MEKWMEIITMMHVTRTTVAQICKCTFVAIKNINMFLCSSDECTLLPSSAKPTTPHTKNWAMQSPTIRSQLISTLQ